MLPPEWWGKPLIQNSPLDVKQEGINMDNMTTEQGTQTETMGKETEVQGQSTEKEEKLFTQDEVNSFVQSRISRIKGQASKEAKAEYEQKLSELEARENKLMVKEVLQARNMPKELAEVITCTDKEDLNKKLDTIASIYDKQGKDKKETVGFTQIGIGGHPHAQVSEDPVRQAMGLSQKG